MAIYDPDLETWFPHLKRGDYKVTSPIDKKYNCIAWVAENNTKFWWPDKMLTGYWPTDVPREETLKAFVQLYEKMGYKICSNHNFERGFEKIAIFINQTGIPTHAARQLPSGKWTSKLGEHKDIEHSLEALIGQEYGWIGAVLKKPTKSH